MLEQKLLHVTNFDRESWWKFQSDEILKPGKMSTSSGHQINDRSDLFHKGQGKLFTHPQGCFKPERVSCKKSILSLQFWKLQKQGTQHFHLLHTKSKDSYCLEKANHTPGQAKGKA